MRKLYNKQSEITRNLSIFFKSVFPSISIPHLKNSVNFIFGMIMSESVVTSDVVKKLKDPWSDVQLSSVIRRYERFLIIIIFKIMLCMMLLLRILFVIIN